MRNLPLAPGPQSLRAIGRFAAKVEFAGTETSPSTALIPAAD